MWALGPSGDAKTFTEVLLYLNCDGQRVLLLAASGLLPMCWPQRVRGVNREHSHRL